MTKGWLKVNIIGKITDKIVCVCVCEAILATTECFKIGLLEPQYEKTDFWHMRKQGRRSVLQLRRS